MANQITQGVLLGEPVGKIARRIKAVTGSNMATATRAARTAVTAAENAGRVDGYRRAEGMGIGLRQEWLATLDGRTRHSHRALDGERAEVGGTFSNGCRYPGDPQAAYAETCNCRCTLVAAVDGADTFDAARWARLPKGMGYEEWRAGKPAVNGAVPAGRTIAEFMDMPGTARELDAAGVSRAEARRALTEQLKEYGIPSQSFRNMSAGDQQKVLDGALAAMPMYENTAWRDARDYAVNSAAVESKGYASAVRRLFGSCGDFAVKDVRRILRHRSGTAFEDLYAYDLTDGRRLGSVVNSDKRLEVVPSKGMTRSVEKAVNSGHRVAMLHNHPGSSAPSAADLVALRSAGAETGVIAAHDGSIYTYQLVDDPASGYNLDQETLNFFLGSKPSDGERAFKAIEQLLGARIEHITSSARRV